MLYSLAVAAMGWDRNAICHCGEGIMYITVVLCSVALL